MLRSRSFKFCLILVMMLLLCQVGFGRDMGGGQAADSSVVAKNRNQHSLFSSSGPSMNVGLHDAGALYSPFIHDIISTNGQNNIIDPESGLAMEATTYPKGSGLLYLYQGNIWVGGIIGDDTLVSTGSDGWLTNRGEFVPPDLGYSTMRTGHYADDEFETVVIDTFDYEGWDVNYHTPLGIKVTRKTYSWADSLYDDFIFMEYTIENIGHNLIEDVWIGIFFDPDINHASVSGGYGDDWIGSLDTLLYAGESSSRALIPYAFDNDGDYNHFYNTWTETSVRGALSLRLLETSFDLTRQNFNWWTPNGYTPEDFGPRQVGTPEHPYYPYSSGGLGQPGSDKDRYNMLSYPEIDYDQMELVIHDSTD